MARFGRQLVQWAYDSPVRWGYLYLTASEKALTALGPTAAPAWWGLVLVSLVSGLLSVGVWSVGAVLFDPNSANPALLTAAVIILWPMRRPLTSLAQLTVRHVPSRSLLLGVLAISVVLLVCELQSRNYPMEDQLSWAVAWIRPWETHFRVLILAPLWGVWTLFIGPKLCHHCERTDAATAALATRVGPLMSAALMALPLGGTLLYFQWLGVWVFIPALAPLAAAVIGPALLCRRTGGLGRRALLAASAATQLVFFLSYLVARHYWTSRYFVG